MPYTLHALKHKLLASRLEEFSKSVELLVAQHMPPDLGKLFHLNQHPRCDEVGIKRVFIEL